MKPICLLACLLILSDSAFAQTTPADIRSAASRIAARLNTSAAEPFAAAAQNRDSVKNGAAIGALIGGIGGALFGLVY